MSEVCLIIKAPNQKYEDHKLNCQLSWTVLQLKSTLSKEYPSKPAISDQRLIYSGHLLKDEQVLRDIVQLADESNTHTFHLVCRPMRKKNESVSEPSVRASQTNVETRSQPQNNGSNTIHSPFNLSDNVPSTGDQVLDHINTLANEAAIRESYQAMLTQYYQFMSYYYLTSPTMPNMDYSALYSAFYSNIPLNGFNQTVTGGNGFSLFNNLSNTDGDNNVPNGNDAPLNAANQRPVPAAAANNGNDERDGAQENRDWIDVFYSFSKALIMLSILYFYSSFGRLLLFVLVVTVLYFYNTNRTTRNLQNIADQPPNNNEQMNGAAERTPMEQEVNNNQANTNAVETQDNVQAQGAATELGTGSPYSGIRLVWVFVSSLFTSLIPDPPAIN